MINFFVGLFLGIFIGIIIMSLMKVSTINDLLNRNQELEETNNNLRKKLKGNMK